MERFSNWKGTRRFASGAGPFSRPSLALAHLGGRLWPPGLVVAAVSTVQELERFRAGAVCGGLRCMPMWLISWCATTGLPDRLNCQRSPV